MKLRGLLMACLVSSLTSAFAVDAELHQETSNEEQRFKGVFPPDVKTIAMISPASYPGSELHKRGIELLKASGYTIKLGKHAFDLPEEGKTSAPLASRLEDFYNAWNDEEVDMILCVRGGGGCFELLNNLDFGKLKKRDNLRLQGYSDVTILVCAMQSKRIGRPIAGPMSGSIAGLKPESIEEMRRMHHGEEIGPIPLKPIVGGDCEGLILAGLVERFNKIWKTEFKPDTKGRIVIIENVRRPPAEIRQCFDELIKEGFFEQVSGVVFGHFIRCGTPQEINEILNDVAHRIGKPVYRNFPFGHSSLCYILDFSRKMVIKDAKAIILKP